MDIAENNEKISDVGEKIDAANAGWSFNGDVVASFSEHVRRSVPHYDLGHDMVCKLSDFFLKADSLCYEIGVSTGDLLKKLVEYNTHKPNVRWVGLDVEQDMIDEASTRLAAAPNVSLETADIIPYEFETTDMIASYYCIQFIHPRVRQDVIKKIYNALNWGGAFIWFEKIRGPDARFQDILTTLYTDFKLEQGYSPSEIIAKTRSLKGVLEPFSTQGNLDLLTRAGFTDVTTIMKYMCFEGVLAIK